MIEINDLPFSTRYNHHAAGLAGIVFEKPSLVRQEFKTESDINWIMQRYQRTGVLDSVSALQGVFGDVSDLGEYQTMLDTVNAASDAFYGLPAKIRKMFDNDPSQLLAFVQDPANTDEAIRLGLAVAPAAPPVDQNPPPADGSPEGADTP